MAEEIKEIFKTKLYFDLDETDYIKIQNYITNLQKENEILKNQLYFIGEQNKSIDKLENGITNLQIENENLRIEISARETVCDDYKSRNEKAVEYIKENWGSWCSNHYTNATNVVNILQGGDE
jgi:predicted  nucleic acid-binding Zn-ribbon protein